MITKTISLVALVIAMAGCVAPAGSKGPYTSTATATTDVVKRQDLVGYSFFDGKLVIPASAQGTAFSPFDTPIVSVSTGLGKYVERGEPIIKLSIPGADQAAIMAKAQASSASASYSEAKAAASGPVKEAQQALADAKAAEQAARDTVASGGTADVAAATQARMDAETALKQAQQEMRQSTQPSKQDVNQATAELQAVRADAQKGIIRAPVTGTVVSFEAKPGMMAKSNQALASIVNFEAARVQGMVPPELKDLVTKDTRVIIAMNGSSADPLDGRVLDVTIAPPTKGQKGAGYLAVIAFENPRSLVQPSTSVKRIGVKTGVARNVLVVPVGAVSLKDGKSVVSVQSGTDWIETPVVVGISDGALVEIKSGLTEGAVVRVITQPADSTP